MFHELMVALGRLLFIAIFLYVSAPFVLVIVMGIIFESR